MERTYSIQICRLNVYARKIDEKNVFGMFNVSGKVITPEKIAGFQIIAPRVIRHERDRAQRRKGAEKGCLQNRAVQSSTELKLGKCGKNGWQTQSAFFSKFRPLDGLLS